MSRTSKKAQRDAGISAKDGKLWSQAIRRAVMKEDRVEGTKQMRLDRLAKKLVQCGLAGDTTAMKEIGDRLEGKVAQAISGPEGEPIKMIMEIEFVEAEDGRPKKK